MKIAFYLAKNGNWQDKLISFFTISKYSHCELVFPSGEFGSASPRDGGVRLKYIEQNTKWEIFDLKNPDGTEISVEQENICYLWFKLYEGQQAYDWPGAIMSLFGVNWTSDDKKFCSYVCAQLLELDPIVTPKKLFKNLSAAKMIEPLQNLMLVIK
jgi:hypothetical protein